MKYVKLNYGLIQGHPQWLVSETLSLCDLSSEWVAAIEAVMESTGKIWVEPKPYFSFAPEHSNTPSKWLVIINIFLFPFFLYFTSLRLHPPFFSLSFSFIFSYLLRPFLSPQVCGWTAVHVWCSWCHPGCQRWNIHHWLAVRTHTHTHTHTLNT